MSELRPKDLTLHMIGNAHLDPVWLWDWREGLQEALDTGWAAVDRLRETEEFVFTRPSAAIYRWIQDHDEELFAEIKRYVAEGRWEIVGGWWEQPDCNLPGGESFVRHCLYGKRYFLREFGFEVRVGYNVDSFGHNAGLPQILARAGYDYYLFCRPDPREKWLPGMLFWWESAEGSRVLACRPLLHYASWGHDLVRKTEAAVYLATAYAQGGYPVRDVPLMYGVGNHGGGPTRENLAFLQAQEANPQFASVKFSRLDDYFDLVAPQGESFPSVGGDLQYHSRGCYTSLSLVKWFNRRCEMSLLTGERLGTMLERAGLVGCLPGDLEEAWHRVLFNQFHDILGGCSIKRAYNDVLGWYWEALSLGGHATGLCLERLAGAVPPGQAAEPVLVVNPLPWARRETVDLGEGRVRLVDVPALGWVVADAAVTLPPPSDPVRVTPTSLENECLRVTLDEQGRVASLWDWRLDRELLAGPANRLLVLEDPGDAWGHEVVEWNHVIGEMVATGPAAVAAAGPERGVLRLHLAWGDSQAELELALSAGSPLLECSLTLDWHEKLRMLKVAFPLDLAQPAATFEHSYAWVELPADGAERHAQHFVDLSGESWGAALLNDCKYGYDARGAELRLTLTRSPVYAHHHPTPLEEGKRYWYLDQGEVVARWGLLPHVGSWQEAAVPRAGWEFNNPLLSTPVLPAGSEAGVSLPATGSLAEVGPDNVVCTVFKPAEEDGETVARLYESCGRATRAWLSLPGEGRRWEFDLGAGEIRTFRLPGAGSEGPLVETDLLERER